ncbi:uncharacterized protein B0P05DRAFT_582590 [Gilbertella persicaria]|uniref:uncharacterized protein n=1 Tax=Gilbertella persicaria TaxID=101096 RepID=UPI00221FDE6C|nr:uncharacterized protein B0P05DRAFT_582590 [Gilbertella persicaria]KAI8098240.1 hypothetical protein B0P05DRAFT_582590 [Gilbertella persicaria]
MSQQKSDSKSNSSSFVPYYGSREPKQSVVETDRLIFQMMDDILKTTYKEQDYLEEPEEHHYNPHLWRFRTVIVFIMVLLIVVATVVVSELTKERS